MRAVPAWESVTAAAARSGGSQTIRTNACQAIDAGRPQFFQRPIDDLPAAVDVQLDPGHRRQAPHRQHGLVARGSSEPAEPDAAPFRSLGQAAGRSGGTVAFPDDAPGVGP